MDWTPEISTALPTGHAHLRKEFSGGVQGTAITQFSYAFDDAGGGSYMALESFEGSLGELEGAFNFAHSATTTGGSERSNEFFLIVPGSGTGDLAGISGTGALIIDADGTHRMRFDYELNPG